MTPKQMSALIDLRERLDREQEENNLDTDVLFALQYQVEMINILLASNE